MWGPQHGHVHGQTIPTGSRHPTGDSLDLGKAALQQERVGQRAGVAVVGIDRTGEPAQLPTRPAGTANPRTVTPVLTGVPEGAVALSGARRPSRSHLGHVDLEQGIEGSCAVPGQHAGEPGHEARSDHQGHAAGSGPTVEAQQGPHIVDIIGDRHHRHLANECVPGQIEVVSVRSGQQHRVGVGRHPLRAVGGHGSGAERTNDRFGHGPVGITDDHFVHRGRRQQLASGSRPHGPRPHDGHPNHLPTTSRARPDGRSTRAHRLRPCQSMSGPESSRQPPLWGGIPPDPRSRRNAAMAAPAPNASAARRIAWIIGCVPSLGRRTRVDAGRSRRNPVPTLVTRDHVGLARIELATSPLSGVRSNRLSYSPEAVARYRWATPFATRWPEAPPRLQSPVPTPDPPVPPARQPLRRRARRPGPSPPRSRWPAAHP